MPQYAARTSVSIDRSRTEIEKTLDRYGATAFRYSRAGNQAMIEFVVHNRLVRFLLPLPTLEDFETTPGGRERTELQAKKAWEQACRQRWRALCLAIKAKLEAVEADIATFEREFLAYLVDPATNRTVAEVILPQLEESYAANRPQQLLLTGPDKS